MIWLSCWSYLNYRLFAKHEGEVALTKVSGITQKGSCCKNNPKIGN